MLSASGSFWLSSTLPRSSQCPNTHYIKMAILRFIQLDTTAVLNYAAVILVFWYIITSVITWKSLRHIPGPFLGKFSHFWSIYHQLAGDVGPVHLGLKKYNSPLVRTGPHYLVTTDPNIWKYVNAARSTYQRDMWWAAGRIDYQRPSLADTLDSASHDKMKAKVAGGHSGRDIDLEIIINEQIAKLVDAMRTRTWSTLRILVGSSHSMLLRDWLTARSLGGWKPTRTCMGTALR